MKNSRSTTLIALCTILIGALLIITPSQASKWLVMAIGALFLVPGIISVATYLWQRHKKQNMQAQASQLSATDGKKDKADGKKDKVKNMFPFIGIGSVLFGAVLLITPSTFHKTLLFILGAFLVIAGLQQIYRFIKLRKLYKLEATPYIVSSLISIAGIVVIILCYKAGNLDTAKAAGENPLRLPSIIFGVASLIFGITEIIYAIQFRKSDTPASTQDKTPAASSETNNSDKQSDNISATVSEKAPGLKPAVSTPDEFLADSPVSQNDVKPSSPVIEAEIDSEA